MTTKFSPATFRFLQQLAKNNNRPWFQEHKAEFETAVLIPAVDFIKAAAPGLARISPHIVADARPFGGSVSRIYRDTRFSKDKSPYRTEIGVHFSHDEGGSMGEHLPGFYFHLAAGESMVASGIWRPSPSHLDKIRSAIVADTAGWAKVRASAPPKGGESYARVPAGFDKEHRFADDLRRKDFFTSVPATDSQVVAPGFPQKFVATCRRIDPLNRFLARAIGVAW